MMPGASLLPGNAGHLGCYAKRWPQTYFRDFESHLFPLNGRQPHQSSVNVTSQLSSITFFTSASIPLATSPMEGPSMYAGVLTTFPRELTTMPWTDVST